MSDIIFADELARQLGVAKELLPELANQRRLLAVCLWDGYRLPHQRRFQMWQRALGAALIIPRPCRGTRAGAYGPHGRQPQGFRALQFARATIAHGWPWRSASVIRDAIHTGRLPTPRLPGPILLAHTL